MPGSVPVDDDRFHDRCGLFGIFGHPEAAHLTYLGLYALQHRGQESAGIVSSDGEHLRLEKGMGLVNDVFTDERLATLAGDRAMGHVRYSTAGDTVATNAQPILIECHRGPIALGHNGNLVNAAILRHELEAAGSIFQSTSDTEVILHLYARSHRERLEDAIAASLSKVMGAFSLLFLTPDALVAARDPWGFRPLVIGQLDGAPIVCSETCALDLIDAEYVRDVEPGELVVIDRTGLRSFRPFPPEPPSQCIFEHVYFARPDSQVFGRNVLESRLALGRQLAREAPADADIVVPVPDSGMGAALGYSQESGLPFRVGAHPQPLRGPDVHRAPAVDPVLRGEDQAQPGGERPRRASGSCSSTTPSCAAPPRARSWAWSGRRGRARCTCASAARPPPAPATTASTPRSRAS